MTGARQCLGADTTAAGARSAAEAARVTFAVAVAVVAVNLALLAPAQAAERVAAGARPLSDGKDTLVYRSGPSTLSVAGGPSAGRSFEVPAECEASATSRTAVALRCGAAPGDAFVPRVLTLADGRVRAVPVAASEYRTTEILEVGSRWMLVSEERTLDFTRRARIRSLLDWRTGRRIDLSVDPYGSRRVLSLDRAEPARALCSPLRRAPEPESPYNQTRFAPASLRGRWLVQLAPAPARVRWTFQRCGERRPGLRIASKYAVGVTATHAAYARDRELRIHRLGDERRHDVRIPVVANRVALTRRYAYVAGDRNGASTLYRVALPRRR